jgi:hypothetical protein
MVVALTVVGLCVWAILRRDWFGVFVSIVGLGLVLAAPAVRPPIGVFPATIGIVMTFIRVLGNRMPGGSSFVVMVSILAFGIVFNSLAVNAVDDSEPDS